MKIIVSITLLALAYFLPSSTPQTDYAKVRNEAEQLYVAGSYARAHELYATVDKSRLERPDVRWVEFRLADTTWRAQAQTQTADNTKFDEAQKALEDLVRVVDRDDHDLVWAEAHESLGDFFWTRNSQMNWGGAWQHYQPALDWWAGQRDIARARDRYLRIIFKAAESNHTNEYYFYTY